LLLLLEIYNAITLAAEVPVGRAGAKMPYEFPLRLHKPIIR
jgi:hypothetical protein